MAYQGFSNLFNQTTHQINIYCFSTNDIILFPAMLTNFSDSFKSNWNKTSVLGRMDPIATFKDTTRTINIAFDLPAYSETEAAINMRKLQILTQGLYPVYEDIKTSQRGTSVLSSPPMFRIKFANLIQNAIKDVEFEGDNDDGMSGGLLGYIDGFDYKPELDAGVFIIDKYIVPKLVKVSLNFNVLHEHGLGSRVGDDGPIVKVSRFPRLAQEAINKKLISALNTDSDAVDEKSEEEEADDETAGVPQSAATSAPSRQPAAEPSGAAGRGAAPASGPASGAVVNLTTGVGKSSESAAKITAALKGQGDSRGGSP
jgi:hypothetical protein